MREEKKTWLVWYAVGFSLSFRPQYKEDRKLIVLGSTDFYTVNKTIAKNLILNMPIIFERQQEKQEEPFCFLENFIWFIMSIRICFS